MSECPDPGEDALTCREALSLQGLGPEAMFFCSLVTSVPPSPSVVVSPTGLSIVATVDRYQNLRLRKGSTSVSVERLSVHI